MSDDREHWIRVAGWWLNNQTGETRSAETFSPSGWFRQGNWWVNYDGSTRPISMGDPRGTNEEVREPEEPVTFTWKGKELILPTSETVKRSEIPYTKLCLWLVERLWELRGKPTAPPCGYSQAAKAAGVGSVMAVFGPLGQVTRFCNRNGWFDLHALIVHGQTGKPGGGYFSGDDCKDEDEWTKYIDAVIMKINE